MTSTSQQVAPWRNLHQLTGVTMDKGPEGLEKLLWIVGYALFAALGGALGFVMKQMDAAAPIKFWRVVMECGAAGFAGVLASQLCEVLGMSVQWTIIVVGVMGWVGGSAAMRSLEKVVNRKIGAE